jgi:hypothetical protein
MGRLVTQTTWARSLHWRRSKSSSRGLQKNSIGGRFVPFIGWSSSVSHRFNVRERLLFVSGSKACVSQFTFVFDWICYSAQAKPYLRGAVGPRLGPLVEKAGFTMEDAAQTWDVLRLFQKRCKKSCAPEACANFTAWASNLTPRERHRHQPKRGGFRGPLQRNGRARSGLPLVQLVPGMRIARHLNPQRVNRGMRAAEQRLQIRSAEGEVDRLLRPSDNADLPAVRRHDPDAARAGAINPPVLSTFNPSGTPGSEPSFKSAKMLRPTMLAASSSRIARMCCEERVLATYIVCSSATARARSGIRNWRARSSCRSAPGYKRAHRPIDCFLPLDPVSRARGRGNACPGW